MSFYKFLDYGETQATTFVFGWEPSAKNHLTILLWDGLAVVRDYYCHTILCFMSSYFDPMGITVNHSIL